MVVLLKHMKAYTTFLKGLGGLLLIPVAISIVIFLGYIGFAIDFGNAFGGSGGGTMYIFVLPLMFICGLIWLVYSLMQKSSVRRAKKQEAATRQQVYKEYELGETIQDRVVYLLTKHGQMTMQQLAERCKVDVDEMNATIRIMLQAGTIRQNLQQRPAVFYLGTNTGWIAKDSKDQSRATS